MMPHLVAVPYSMMVEEWVGDWEEVVLLVGQWLRHQSVQKMLRVEQPDRDLLGLHGLRRHPDRHRGHLGVVEGTLDCTFG